MSDILLSFGVQKGTADVERIRNDLDSILSDLDRNPPQVRVGLTIDESAIAHFRAQLSSVVSAISLTNGAPITINISGLGEITAEAGRAQEALGGVAEAAQDASQATQAATDSTRQSANEAARAAQEAARAEQQRQSLLRQSTNLISKMQDAERNWTAAATGRSSESYDNIRAYRVELEALQQRFLNGQITADQFRARINELSTNFATSASQIRLAGEQTKTFSERLSGLAAKFSTWLSVSQVIMLAVRSIKQMVSTVIELDTAMTELKKVTNESDATYARFLDGATERAKKLGASISDTVTATADFARLGYGIDDASTLADVAIIYKNIGDGIEDISTASESIISTMQAFGIASSDAMSIVDRFNEVGNNFAISSAGIGEAMQRSAAAMASANNTIDETIALITAANTIVQNPESVGTTLKTVSMYLRAAKTEAEEAGESTAGMADSVSELRQEILDLTGQKVDIQIDDDTFKSTYQILKELSAVWGSLTDVSRANLLELIGGKRNANVVSALLENFKVAENALKSSMESAGSAVAENEKHLDSIKGKLAEFTAQFQSLSTTFINSEFVKGIVEFGTFLLKILEGVGRLVNALGGLSNVLLAIAGTILTIKADSIVERLSAIAYSIKNLTFLTGTFGVTFKQCFDMARLDGAGNLRAVSMGLAGGFTEVAASASVAQIAVGSFFALLIAIPAVIKFVDLVTVSLEESREALAELGQEFRENESRLQELNTELETTADRIAELEGKEALTFTEAEELQNLIKQNNELEREIALLETIQKIKSQERNAAFVQTMEKDLANAKEYLRSHDYSSSDYSAVYTDTKKYGKGRSVRTMSEMDLINSAFMRRAEIIEALSGELTEKERTQLESLQYEIDNYLTEKLTELNGDVESSGVSYISNPTTEDEKAVNAWLGFIDDFNDKMMIAMGTDGAKENAVNRLILGDYAEVTKDLQELGKQGTVTADHLADPKYDDFINKCIELGIISDDSAGSLDFLALAFNTVGNAVGNATHNAADAEARLRGLMATMAEGGSAVSTRLSYALGDLAGEDGKVYASTIKEIGEAIASYEDGHTGWTSEETAYNRLADAASEYGVSVDELLTVLIELGLVQDDLATTTDQLATNFSSLKEELNTVNSAISEQATNGSITLETYNALIAASSDYASCIEYENGYMQLNTEKARELIDAKTQLQILELEQAKIDEAENYKRIAQALEDAAESDDVYRAALQAELDVSEQLITKYRVMQSELAETLSAYNKWKTAQNAPETGDMYDDTLTALEQIQDGLDSGKVGTAKYEASVALLVPEANREDVAAYMETLKRYISEDMTGVSNFISDSITEGLMVDDGAGNITIVSDATIQDFCDKLKITPSMAQAIFGELEEYGWEFDWTAEDFIGAIDAVQVPVEVDMDELAALQAQLADYRAQLAAIENDPLTLQADVTALEEKIAITEQAIVDAGGVVPVDTSAAEGSLQAVQEDLDQIAEKADIVAAKVIGDMGARETVVSLQAIITKLIQIDNKKISDKHYNVYQHTITDDNGESSANGTSSAKGGRTLVGELGPELVVSDDRYYTVGSNGAEFVNLKPGDMVFNHVDTKKIMDGKEGVRGQALWMGARPTQVAINDGGGGSTSKTITDIVAGAITGGVAAAVKVANDALAKSGISGGGKKPSGGGSGGSGGGGSGGSGGGSSNDDEESWFEKQLKEHQHLVEMDKESQQDYLDWLDDAYKKAYEEGIIDLDDFYKYEEEVYQGRQDLFKDHLSDIDHEISMLEAGVGNSDEIIALSLQAIQDIEAELAAARAAGLDENSDYIQYLEQQWQNYNSTVIDLREEAEAEAESAIDDLVEYRIKMLKQEIQDQKDALSKQLSDLQDFYDKQRKMLQDQYDEEKYLEEQKEKRKSVTDIQSELAMLENDNSAWAQKRKLELQAELSDAEKELNSFEKDHALDMTLDMLDEQQAAQEAEIQAQMDALDEKLNDPHALFNQALEDIKNNTAELYQQFIEYNRKHGTGNDEDIEDMWEDAYKADLEYQDTHNGEHPDGIEIGNYTGYERPENPAPPEPPANPPATPEDNTPSEPETPEAPQLTDAIKKKVAAAIWNGGYGWGNGSTRTNRLTEVFGAGNGIQDLVNKGVGKSGVSLTSEYTYANMRKKFKGYASGTDNATPGWHELFEGDLDEYVFTSSDGNRYRMFSGLGDKVLNGEATDFLYDFANSGGSILTKMISDLFGLSGLSNIAKPVQAVEIHSGDIIVQGNANERTVSEIRRAQRENLEFVIKEFNKLNR